MTRGLKKQRERVKISWELFRATRLVLVQRSKSLNAWRNQRGSWKKFRETLGWTFLPVHQVAVDQEVEFSLSGQVAWKQGRQVQACAPVATLKPSCLDLRALLLRRLTWAVLKCA